MSAGGPTPAKNEAAPISLFVRLSSREFLLSASLLAFQNSLYTWLSKPITNRSRLPGARHRSDLLLLVVETPTDPATETNRGSRSGGFSFHRPATAQNLAIRVNGSFPRGLRHGVYRFVVKGSAPELFPAISLVRIWFTRCAPEERRAFDWAGVACYKALKVLDILSLTNCPLN